MELLISVDQGDVFWKYYRLRLRRLKHVQSSHVRDRGDKAKGTQSHDRTSGRVQQPSGVDVKWKKNTDIKENIQYCCTNKKQRREEE